MYKVTYKKVVQLEEKNLKTSLEAHLEKYKKFKISSMAPTLGVEFSQDSENRHESLKKPSGGLQSLKNKNFKISTTS